MNRLENIIDIFSGKDEKDTIHFKSVIKSNEEHKNFDFSLVFNEKENQIIFIDNVYDLEFIISHHTTRTFYENHCFAKLFQFLNTQINIVMSIRTMLERKNLINYFNKMFEFLFRILNKYLNTEFMMLNKVVDFHQNNDKRLLLYVFELNIFIIYQNDKLDTKVSYYDYFKKERKHLDIFYPYYNLYQSTPLFLIDEISSYRGTFYNKYDYFKPMQKTLTNNIVEILRLV